MFTIIGGDGKEYGPASADQLRAWISSGRANLETKAKALGTDEWRRLGDFAEFFPTDGAPPVIAAPVAEAAPADAATLLARAKPLDIFGCLDRSFTLWKSNFGSLVGATLLICLLEMVVGFIPILGIFANLFLKGAFYGGLYYFYLGKN